MKQTSHLQTILHVYQKVNESLGLNLFENLLLHLPKCLLPRNERESLVRIGQLLLTIKQGRNFDITLYKNESLYKVDAFRPLHSTFLLLDMGCSKPA